MWLFKYSFHSTSTFVLWYRELLCQSINTTTWVALLLSPSRYYDNGDASASCGIIYHQIPHSQHLIAGAGDNFWSFSCSRPFHRTPDTEKLCLIFYMWVLDSPQDLVRSSTSDHTAPSYIWAISTPPNLSKKYGTPTGGCYRGYPLHGLMDPGCSAHLAWPCWWVRRPEVRSGPLRAACRAGELPGWRHGLPRQGGEPPPATHTD